MYAKSKVLPAINKRPNKHIFCIHRMGRWKTTFYLTHCYMRRQDIMKSILVACKYICIIFFFFLSHLSQLKTTFVLFYFKLKLLDFSTAMPYTTLCNITMREAARLWTFDFLRLLNILIYKCKKKMYMYVQCVSLEQNYKQNLKS